MSPREFWIIYYGKVDRNPKNLNKPTDEQYDEMLELLKKSRNGE